MQQAPQTRTPDSSRKHAALALNLAFVVLAAGILLAGSVYYQRYEAHYRAQVESQLSAIADLKVSQLVQWRRERIGDGETLRANSVFAGLAHRLVTNPGDADARHALEMWLRPLKSYYAYDRVSILDAQGVERISIPSGARPGVSAAFERASAAARSDEVTLADFHRDAPTDAIHLAVLAPVHDGTPGGHPIATVVMRIDPNQYLYPFISQWPTASATAETLLVRREGDEAVFLNELRFQKGTALALRFPLTRTDVLAVRAALGQQGIVRGLDYRGIPVVGYVRPVPESPWFIVARMDESEVSAPLRERLWAVAILVLVLLLGAAVSVRLVWVRQLRLYDRGLVAAAGLLRKSEARYRELVENANSFVLRLDTEGRVTYVNQYTLQFFGYSEEEMLGRPVTDNIVPPAESTTGRDLQAMVEEIVESPDGHAYNENENVTRDGRRVWVAWSNRALYDERGNRAGHLAIGTDMTPRREAERALAASEEQFRTAFEMASVGMTMTAPDGTLLRVNKALCEMMGRTEAELVGSSMVAISHPEDVSRSQFFMADIATEAQGWGRMEKRYLRPDGEVVWADVTSALVRDAAGTPRHFITHVQDITARKQAEDALADSEAKFRTLFATVTEGIALHEVVYDEHGAAVDYRLLDCNPAYEAHTGIVPAQVINQLASVVYGVTPAPYLAEYARVAETGEPFVFETHFAPLNRDFRISVTSPGRGRFATVFEDVTDRLKRERELRETNEQLEAFTYTISHDLRSPLVTVQTFLGYLEQDLAAGDAARVTADAEYVQKAARKMEQLLDELLDMSRLGRVSHPPTKATFHELVEEALGAVAGEIAERGVEINVGEDDITLVGDRRRLVQVWQNLIENSVKYAGDTPIPRIEIGIGRDGTDIVFNVCDNGIGVDARYHERVFGLFEKLDPGTPGTGLGLALVKRIVELNGGRIWLDSPGLGKGTCVRFTLPGAVKARGQGATS